MFSGGITLESQMTKYEEYLRTSELLALQKDERDLCCPEEMTFQIIHQVSELHYKLAIQYLELAKAYMEAKCLSRAINEMKKVDSQLKHLLETLNLMNDIRSHDYIYIRENNNLDSTLDSPGYRAVLEMGPRLWKPFKSLLDERGITVAELLNKGDSHYELYLLLQEMISFDEIFQVLRNYYIKKDREYAAAKNQHENENRRFPSTNSEKFQFFPEIWKAISEQIQPR